ncbi:hypothetical protein [Psychrobacillus sp. MER TA 171]|uniref:hypothetical protein n=1 Tax=Psychrobacillus sp. MER TA 171 TaxID=2939577 RepID=UPI00203E4645|nr:hypothetical protein [Psychrobacillus sp. MER TA 171]MCM3360297.1 hypothetical protein [Psychrobacillus sp. MER TA 171]
MIFIGDGEICMVKEYDFDEFTFVPRKGDIIEDQGFSSYLNPTIVTYVIINLDGEYCTVFLSRHKLIYNTEEHLEEVLKGYEENNWIRT